jgi:hypothetical protein
MVGFPYNIHITIFQSSKDLPKNNTTIRRRIFCMLRNTRSKLMSILFHLANDYTVYSIFKVFDTFLKRKTNLKSTFGALSVKWCWNEETLDGTPRKKWCLKFSKFCLYCCINMASILQHHSINDNCTWLTIFNYYLCFSTARYTQNFRLWSQNQRCQHIYSLVHYCLYSKKISVSS